MRCNGRTKNLSRCKNNCKIIFCRHHKLQWWAILVIIATLGGLFQDIIKPIFFEKEQITNSEKEKATEIALNKISDSLKVITNMDSHLESINKKLDNFIDEKSNSKTSENELIKKKFLSNVQRINIGISRSFAESILGSSRYIVQFGETDETDEFYIINQNIIRLIYNNEVV